MDPKMDSNNTIVGLKALNIKLKAKEEVCQLSASEPNTTSLPNEKRENETLKRTYSLEKRLAKLQLEINEEKEKTSKLEEVLAAIKQHHKGFKAQLKEELKDKDEAKALLITKQPFKEQIEARVNRKIEEMRLKIKVHFDHHKDEVYKLEQDISNAKGVAKVIKKQHKLAALSPLGDPKEELNGRKCIICKTDEASILLLPCAHQVMCVTCCDMFGFILTSGCPICMTPIKQNIHVFSKSS